MPRKKKEEDNEPQSDTPITEKIGDVVATVRKRASKVVAPVGEKVGEAVAPLAEKVSEAVSAVGDTVGGAMSSVGDTVGGMVASVTGGNAGENGADDDSVAENEESLPANITKGADTNQGKELPEYLRRRRTEIGRVVSDKMQKTVVVSVQRSKPHPLYKKVMRRTVKFMAHDEMNSGMGDTVRIVESRPMSRHKRWQVIEIIQKAQQI